MKNLAIHYTLLAVGFVAGAALCGEAMLWGTHWPSIASLPGSMRFGVIGLGICYLPLWLLSCLAVRMLSRHIRTSRDWQVLAVTETLGLAIVGTIAGQLYFLIVGPAPL